MYVHTYIKCTWSCTNIDTHTCVHVNKNYMAMILPHSTSVSVLGWGSGGLSLKLRGRWICKLHVGHACDGVVDGRFVLIHGCVGLTYINECVCEAPPWSCVCGQWQACWWVLLYVQHRDKEMQDMLLRWSYQNTTHSTNTQKCLICWRTTHCGVMYADLAGSPK